MILEKQRYSKKIIGIILNSICNIVIFILFSWDKIYYIFKKEGNNQYVYFIYKRHEECLKHKSTHCGCKLNMTNEEIEISINNYIDIYKYVQPYLKLLMVE